MNIAFTAALWAAVALGVTAYADAATAQAGSSSVPGITEPRTEVITVTPPEGWVLSVWQGGTIETGEFTPPGQTGPRYVDLLGYSVLPLVPRLPDDLNALRTYEIDTLQGACQHRLFKELPPSQGWLNLSRICLGREGAADPDQLELEFAATTVGAQGIYRVWRSWRGTPAELAAMVSERTGANLAPIIDSASGTLSQAAFGQLVATMDSVMVPDLNRREICDLSAPRDCSFLAPELPDYFALGPWVGRPVIAGFYAEPLGTVSRQQFLQALGAADDGSPNQVVVGLTPDEIDWGHQAQVDHYLQLIALGQGADGGGLVIVEPLGGLTDAERVSIRANVVAAARRLQRPDHPPSVVRVVIPSE